MTSDLLIVGAGPAGVSAALWAREFELDVAILEGSARIGGQLQSIHFHPRDWVGVPQGDGPMLAAVMSTQLRERGVVVHVGDPVAAIEPAQADAPCVLRTTAGVWLEARAVLVASGLHRRRLEVPGEHELAGRGVSVSATRDRTRFAGRQMLVVGGGDAAYENALILATAGCHVAIAVRGRSRARAEFRERVAAEPRIEVLEGTRVLAIEGVDSVSGVRLADVRGERWLAVEGVVVKVGALPNTEWCAGALERDDEGYLITDARLRTSAPGVWAAGDVTRPALPSLAVAVGHGALAVADLRAVLRGDTGPPPMPAGRAGRD